MNDQLVYYVVQRGGVGLFLAYDNHSGGYPWSSSFNSAEKFSTLERANAAKNGDSKCGNIYRCTVTAEVVTSEDVDDAVRKAALAKLTPEEIKALGLEGK